jgi:hypothetical protein
LEFIHPFRINFLLWGSGKQALDSDSSSEDGDIGDGLSFNECKKRKKRSAQQGEGTYGPLGPD